MGLPSRYLPSRRKPWYSQEKRKPAPFLLPCVLRIEEGMAPRFIMNKSRRIATNSYLLLYPKVPLTRLLKRDCSLRIQIFDSLCRIGRLSFEKEGRLYGGGLIKIEPRELGKISWELSPSLASLYENEV